MPWFPMATFCVVPEYTTYEDAVTPWDDDGDEDDDEDGKHVPPNNTSFSV